MATEGTVHQVFKSRSTHEEYEVPDEEVRKDLEQKLEELKDVLRLP